MRFRGEIDLHVSGEQILRQPTFWDRLRKRLGGEPDLRTDRIRAALEAAAVVEATRKALARLGATNAVSLVIDDQVLFQDRDGRTDDLGDLFLAFSEHESVFGAGFKLLRLAVEHREAGLHLILEIIAQGEHAVDEPAARIVISGRIQDFEPRPGEDADAYRARVEPLTRDSTLIEVARRQFESFVARVAEVMSASMPEARVDVRKAEAQVAQPERRPSRARAPRPTDPGYDPYVNYYPHRLDSMLSVMMWASLLSFAMPPHVVVVNEHGHALGSAQEVAADHGVGADQADLGGDHGGGHDGDFGAGSGDFGAGSGDFGDMGDDLY